MADIGNQIDAIRAAKVGEEVRDKIADALEAMNAQAAAAQEWATGEDDPTAEPGPENNAEYWAGQAAAQAEAAASSAASGIAALANEAQTFDATKTYSAGAYVLYNSVLHRFNTDHAAGAWTGTDAMAVKFGTELTYVKKDISEIEESLGKSAMPYTVTVGGSIGSDGTDSTSEYYSRIEYIDVSGKEKIVIESNRYRIYYYLYRSDYTVISSNGWLSGRNEVNIGTAKHMRVVVRQPSGQASISPTETEVKTNVVIYRKIMANVEEKITDLEASISAHTSRIDELEKISGEIFNSMDVVVGGSINFSDGSDSTSQYYSRVEYIDIEGKFSVTIDPGNLGAYVYTYRSNKAKYSNSDWFYEPTTFHFNLSVKYIRIVMRYPAGQTQTSPSENAVHSNLKITAVNKSAVSNQLMRSNFIPAKSTRYIYAKGKMWEYYWNTVKAIKAAAESDDCWGVSVDVRVTSDGKLVCFHDATVDSQTDGTGQIEDMTWEQVQELNIDKGVWNGSSWVAEAGGATGKIPLLSDAIDACRLYGKVLLIEPKAEGSSAIGNLSEENLEAVMLLLKNKGMIDSCGFIAPTATMTYLEDNYPSVFRFRLYDNSLTASNQNVYAYDPNTVFGAYNSALTEELVSRAHRLGMFVVGYTPRTNPQSDDVAMVGKGLDGIFLFRDPPVLT